MQEQKPELPGFPPTPDKLVQTLFQRAMTEFCSYLLGQHRAVFVSREYVDGLAAEMKETLLRFSKSSRRGWVAAFALVVTGLFVLAFPDQLHAEDKREGPARVLYINAYHPGYKWSDDIENALMSTFNASSRNIELSIEYLDSRRFDSEMQIERLAEMIELKYADYPLDMVITSDNTAFDFAIRHRDRLFPGLPIVFCGYNSFRPTVLKGITNITGVNEEVDFSGTIDLALSVHPDVRTLAFVVSTASASPKRNYETLIQNVFPNYRDEYELVLLKDLSVKDIQHQLNRLSDNTLLFVMGEANDLDLGRPLSPVESMRKISAMSPIPAYSFWDFNLGAGIIGGSVLTGSDQGRVAAELALKILDGVKADDIPVVITSPTSNFFDFPVMSRFGIDEGYLPPDSIIINRPQSVWELYRGQIIAAFTALVVQAILIAALVIAMRQRRAALKSLERERDLLEERVAERTNEVQEKATQLKTTLKREKEYSVLQQKFVSLVSHEFRTPLAIIDGAAQRLIRRGNKLDPAEVEIRANKVRAAVTRMIGLIDTTLFASRLDAGKIDVKIAPCDIGELLLDVCERQSEISPSHQIRVSLDDLPGEIFADRGLLDQAFTNLLSNAVKYSPDSLLIEVKGWRDEDNALFTIADQGLGIHADDLPHMFGRFFRAKTAEGIKGTGIGLTVVKELVQLHGGSVGVDSLEGEGSTFSIRLPINGAGQ